MTHASVLVNGFKLSDTALYACDEGYELQSGSLSAVCLDTGVWSHLSLTCEPVDCDNPKDIANAQVCHRVLFWILNFKC